LRLDKANLENNPMHSRRPMDGITDFDFYEKT
jgi:hypothetical protein